MFFCLLDPLILEKFKNKFKILKSLFKSAASYNVKRYSLHSFE